jgi:hypothetical protein
MSFYFFLSYAADNDDLEEVKRFFADLSVEVRRQLGLKQSGAVVGFRDQEDIKVGVEWERRLGEALQNSKALICLYSPAYFRSEWCRREWEVFRRRELLYQESHPRLGESEIPQPRAIKPIIWMPAHIAEPFSQIQTYRDDVLDDVYRRRGLFRLIHQYDKYKYQYDDFIVQLAGEILCEKELSLPPHPSLTDGLLSLVTHPFSADDKAAIFSDDFQVEQETLNSDILKTQKFPVENKTTSFNRAGRRSKIALAIALLSLTVIACLLIFKPPPSFETEEKADNLDERLVQWSPSTLDWKMEKVGGAQGRRIKGESAGFFNTGGAGQPFNHYRNFTLEFDLRFIGKKGVAWIVRAKDFNNFYLLELAKSTQEGERAKLNFYLCEKAQLPRLLNSAKADVDTEDDQESFVITTEVKGSTFDISIKPSLSMESGSRKLMVFVDRAFSHGGVGLLPRNGREVLLQQWRVAPHGD